MTNNHLGSGRPPLCYTELFDVDLTRIALNNRLQKDAPSRLNHHQGKE